MYLASYICSCVTLKCICFLKCMHAYIVCVYTYMHIRIMCVYYIESSLFFIISMCTCMYVRSYICMYCVHVCMNASYKKIYWRVKYLANHSVIVVDITSIWRKAVAAIYIIAMKLRILALFKFGGQTKNCHTAKLKLLPNKLCIQYKIIVM